MRGSAKIGQVWGIPVRLHYSWFAVFGLVSWSLAAGYLPLQHPARSAAAYWLTGVATSLLFFASIAIHELGHSWIALRHGLRVRSITLFVFGGIAQIVHEPSTPVVEVKIALAGPLTSLVLAAFFGSVRLLIPPGTILVAPATWLSGINLVVVLFNMLPGFPLDGGRVLHAVLWRWTGNYQQSTKLASYTGELLALGFVGFGLLTLVRGNVLGGVWTVLIGWLLQNAAAASHAQSSLQELLRGVTVAQAMTRECSRVTADSSLDQVVREGVLGGGRRCFVVVDNGHLRGLLTVHEVKAIARERWDEVSVGDVMTRGERLVKVTPQEDLLVALQKMDDANVAQMPVVAGDDLLGIISREQVLHYVRTRAELGV